MVPDHTKSNREVEALGTEYRVFGRGESLEVS